jgi:hypothetical protein
LMIAIAAQMSRTITACAPELAPCDDTIAVAPTPRAIDPRAVTVIATFRDPTEEDRTGGGPIWYPGGSMGPTYPWYPRYPAGTW